MSVRLGRVLFYFGWVIAILLVWLGFSIYEPTVSIDSRIVLSIVAAVVWLFFRACYYVLAGE